MSKKKKIPSFSEPSEITPVKAIAPVAKLETLADYYGHYYNLMFNKLGKEEQESLTNNLKRGAQIVRGSLIEFPNVRTFIRDVIEKAEFEYDRFQEKKADAEKAQKALDKK